VAVATITLPVVSRIAAAADRSTFGPTLGRAMRLAIFLTMPAAVGLIVLARPIIALIYQRGEFTAHDSIQTGLALQFYALGLVAYACVKVLSPAFYAINRRWTPMLVSFAAIAINLGLNYWFIFHLGLGHRGLALATALSAAFNFATLYLLMHRFAGGMDARVLGLSTLKCAAASGVLALVCIAGLTAGGPLIDHTSLAVRAAALLGLIAAGAATYAAACFLLRVGEMRDATRAVTSKLRNLLHR
jgi:putative peptidoglycan lipid II flippase